MTQHVAFIVDALNPLFAHAAGRSPALLLAVAAAVGVSVLLYGLTRGREFLVAGCASVLFLVPFVQIG